MHKHIGYRPCPDGHKSLVYIVTNDSDNDYYYLVECHTCSDE